MSGSSMWIIPEAPRPAAATLQDQRVAHGAGLRLGTLYNSKSNADHLLAMIVAGVRAKLTVASVVSLSKPSAAEGADAKLLDQLAAEADCVISAMAD